MGQRGRVGSCRARAFSWIDRISRMHSSKSGSHFLMHLGRVDALDKVRFVAVADQQRLQLMPRNTSQHGWIRNLVAIEMQHRQYRSVAKRIQELVGMP